MPLRLPRLHSLEDSLRIHAYNARAMIQSTGEGLGRTQSSLSTQALSCSVLLGDAVTPSALHPRFAKRVALLDKAFSIAEIVT